MSKRIVICSDGTWNRPDQEHPTNVVRMARAVAAQAPDGRSQVVFYDQGVGTGNLWERVTGGAFGKGLLQNIGDAYRFLVHNFVEGDEVYLFGFSRGAYTARSTAGMLRNCGILKKVEGDRFEQAYDLYRSPDHHPDAPESVEFRRQYSREVRVKFIGVWDTVGALGIPISALKWLNRRKYQFHDVKLSSSVENAFHALSIDERRRPFAPTLWETKGAPGQRVSQVWFAGVHSNVGGGYPDHGLSDLALAWMIERAREAGLAFEDAYLARVLQPSHAGTIYDSKSGIHRFLGSHERRIGEVPSGEESVDPSAVQRFEERVQGYHPANLAAYLSSVRES